MTYSSTVMDQIRTQVGGNTQFHKSRQLALQVAGYYSGVIDGLWGSGSRTAMIALARDHYRLDELAAARSMSYTAYYDNILTVADTTMMAWGVIVFGLAKPGSGRTKESIQSTSRDNPLTNVLAQAASLISAANISPFKVGASAMLYDTAWGKSGGSATDTSGGGTGSGGTTIVNPPVYPPPKADDPESYRPDEKKSDQGLTKNSISAQSIIGAVVVGIGGFWLYKKYYGSKKN